MISGLTATTTRLGVAAFGTHRHRQASPGAACGRGGGGSTATGWPSAGATGPRRQQRLRQVVVVELVGVRKVRRRQQVVVVQQLGYREEQQEQEEEMQQQLEQGVVLVGAWLGCWPYQLMCWWVEAWEHCCRCRQQQQEVEAAAAMAMPTHQQQQHLPMQ